MAEDNKSMFVLISIVAIVAVVGLVVLLMGKGATQYVPVAQPAVTEDVSGVDLAGEAQAPVAAASAEASSAQTTEEETTCVDSDGTNYYVKGTNDATSGTGPMASASRVWDECISSNKLKEYYCGSNGIRKYITNILCDYGCNDGACKCKEGACKPCSYDSDCPSGDICNTLSRMCVPTTTCTSDTDCDRDHLCIKGKCSMVRVKTCDKVDSDNLNSNGGKNPNVLGNIIINNKIVKSDVCKNSISLVEYYCSGNIVRHYNYVCPKGCKDGVCKKYGK